VTEPPPSGALVGREHRLPVRVYYEDTDFTGVVYHATYLRYLERGRTEFLRAVGVHHSELLGADDPTAFVVTRMNLRWLKSARVDDALIVITAYEVARGPRVSVTQSVRRGPDLLVSAEVEAACITPDGRAKRPPRILAEAVRPYLLADPPSGRQGPATRPQARSR